MIGTKNVTVIFNKITYLCGAITKIDPQSPKFTAAHLS
ncbi:hypothetical protein PTUN_a4168 [Pseudoalteromonas tunicata]|nr:hypothetical protein PTUN_a4168 [Pseudoalteromonas tunicata]